MEIKGVLKIIVLKTLKKGSYTGYNLINIIKKETGFWKPSPGSIYPLMNDLLKKELVACEKKSNQKIYSLTKKGKDFYKKTESSRKKIIKEIEEGIRFLEILDADKKNIESIEMLLKIFREKRIPYKNNLEYFIMFKKNLLRALKKKDKISEINSILEGASKKLSKL